MAGTPGNGKGFRIMGAAAGDRAGWSVSTGDINGDGVTDVITGAYAADPLSRIGAGAVYVIYGNNSAGRRHCRERTHVLAINICCDTNC